MSQLSSELAKTKLKLKQFQALYNLQNGQSSRMQSPAQSPSHVHNPEELNMSPSGRGRSRPQSVEHYTFTSAEQPAVFSLDGVLQPRFPEDTARG